MAAAGWSLTDDVGAELTDWGRVITVETRGRRTGRPVLAAVGFVEDGDGSFRVAAGDPDADWARNLEADPRCRVRLGDDTREAVAVALAPAEAAETVRDLIVRYGTPAERLGRGPAFRLRPT